MKPTTMALAAALALAAGPAAAQDAAAPEAEVTADTVLATVDGTEITAGHLLLMRGQLPQQYQGLPPGQLYQGLLQQAISQALLGDTVEALTREAQLALENQERALRAEVAMQALSDEAVTEAALREAYDERYGDAAPTTEYNAAHILVETEEEAAALRAELEAGAEFAALAREHSTGPSGPNGGDLGWFEPGTMVPAFEEVVVALAPGEISQPVETQFGWHLIRLEDTRTKEVPSFEEVRGELQQSLQRAAIEARLQALRAEAEISETGPGEVSTDFLNDPTLLEE